MSLSAAEKVRVVHALDRLGVHFVEAGFPARTPRRRSSSRCSRGRARAGAICAFGMTRRRGVAAEDDRRCSELVACSAPVHPGRQDVGTAPRQGDQGIARREPRDDQRLGRFLRGARQAGRLRRRALLRRLARRSAYALVCLEPRSKPAPRTSRSATPTAPASRQVADATAAVVEALGDRTEVGIHTHNDAECAVANSLAAVEAGAGLVQGTINGYGERCGNANLVSILPALQLKMGYDCVGAGSPSAADGDRALRRRALQRHAGPRPALRGPQRLRPQGRHARRRGGGRRAGLRAHRAGAGRQQPRGPDLRAVRARAL